jgi:hypothetical protein
MEEAEVGNNGDDIEWDGVEEPEGDHAQEGIEEQAGDVEDVEDGDDAGVDELVELLPALGTTEDGLPAGGDQAVPADGDQLFAADPRLSVSTRKRQSADWYLERRERPVYEGAAQTLIQVCYLLGCEMARGSCTDTDMDRRCRSIQRLLPAGNSHPPSLHLLRKILDWREPEDYEQHVCVNDDHVFAKLRKSQYASNKDEKCPLCAEPRFESWRAESGVAIKPRKVFWDLGVEASLQDYFFKITEFVEQRGTKRFDSLQDFYSSAIATDLDTATGGELFRAYSSAWELSYDGFNCFQFASHTLGGVFLRYVTG